MKKICYITTVSMTLDAFILESAKFIHNNTDWDITFVCNEDFEFSNKLPQYIHFHSIPMKRGVSIGGIIALCKMYFFFRKEKFDLIQYSTPNASLYAAVAGKLARIPVRLYCQWGLAYIGFSGKKRDLFKKIEKIVCRMSTWIEPDSYSNLHFSHKEGLYAENIGSVVWNGSACGVNLSKFNFAKKDEYRKQIRSKYNIPDDAYVFGFVGRITRDKGVNELFEAIKRIDQNNVFLLMVGYEEVDETVDKELYRWSKTSERIIYTGFTRVVEQYMAAMDCYVLPSYREGFGMSVVEAEAMGVPVIITNIPGPIDGMVNGVTGIVVEKGSPEQLYDAMQDMITSTEKGKTFGASAMKFAMGHFEQKKLFEKIVDDRKRLLFACDK